MSRRRRAASSDFELQADQLGPAPRSDAPAATAAPPAWLELGGEPDDVTFPVIPAAPTIGSPGRRLPATRARARAGTAGPSGLGLAG